MLKRLNVGQHACWAALGLVLSLTTPTLAEDDAASAAAGEVDAASLATARLHFSNGVELLSESPPNYQDAFHQFELAHTKSGGSWKVLGNLGLCALKLERDGEALKYYRKYLEEGGDEIDPQERQAITKELLLLDGNLGTANLTSSGPKTRITVSRQGSTAPTQAYQLKDGALSLGVRSGSFTIVATSDGERQTWEVVISPGQEMEHHFAFGEQAAAPDSASAPAAAPAAAPLDTDPRTGSSGLKIAGFASLGVGVLALGGGVATGLMAKGKEKNATEECVDEFCPSAGQAEMDSAKSLAMVTNVLFIAGGVLAATGISLVVLGGSSGSSKESASLRLTPALGTQGGGIFASGKF